MKMTGMKLDGNFPPKNSPLEWASVLLSVVMGFIIMPLGLVLTSDRFLTGFLINIVSGIEGSPILIVGGLVTIIWGVISGFPTARKNPTLTLPGLVIAAAGVLWGAYQIFLSLNYVRVFKEMAWGLENSRILLTIVPGVLIMAILAGIISFSMNILRLKKRLCILTGVLTIVVAILCAVAFILFLGKMPPALTFTILLPGLFFLFGIHQVTYLLT